MKRRAPPTPTIPLDSNQFLFILRAPGRSIAASAPCSFIDSWKRRPANTTKQKRARARRDAKPTSTLLDTQSTRWRPPRARRWLSVLRLARP